MLLEMLCVMEDKISINKVFTKNVFLRFLPKNKQVHKPQETPSVREVNW